MGDLFAGGIAERQVIRARHEGVNHAEVHAHVPHGLAAHGAGVVVARVLPKAVAVHEVATGQLLHHQSVSQSASQSVCQSVSQLLGLSVRRKERNYQALAAMWAVCENQAAVFVWMHR